MYGFRPPHVIFATKDALSVRARERSPYPGLDVESPDPLVTSGDFLPDERGRGEPRQQTESSTAVNLSPLQHARELFAIKHCRLRQNWNAKKVLREKDLTSIESSGFQYPLRDVETLSAEALHVVRDDGEIGCHSFRDARCLCRDVKVVVVHHSAFHQLRAVDD